MKINIKTTNENPIKLVMWEKTMMPESKSEIVNGKKQFIKTGNEVEMTTYIFRDSFGDIMKFLSKNNIYRTFEGGNVDITLDLSFNDFQKKNLLKLESVSSSNF